MRRREQPAESRLSPEERHRLVGLWLQRVDDGRHDGDFDRPLADLTAGQPATCQLWQLASECKPRIGDALGLRGWDWLTLEPDGRVRPASSTEAQAADDERARIRYDGLEVDSPPEGT